MSLPTNGYERMTCSAADLVNDGLMYNWTLKDLVRVVEQAWMEVHRDRFTAAESEVRERWSCPALPKERT